MVLKRIIIVLVVILLGILGYMYFYTDVFKKPLSPKDTVEFKLNDLELEVFYNRPSKRGRAVFGALVPYDKVWRTGANEATTFSTNKDLMIDGIYLPAGKYTLWTIPNEENWRVFFNSKQYPWGVNDLMEPMREPRYDIVDIEIPTEALNTTVEQFTIAFDNSTDELKLTMAWDSTKIAVPLNVLKRPN